MSEKMLTTDQAAKAIGTSKTTVLNWISSGVLAAEKKADGRWYITKKDLDGAQAVMTKRKNSRDLGKRNSYDNGLKDDPVLNFVKAIVQDELKSYKNSLSKGRDTYAHEAYLRSSDFARMTGGLVDPEELIRRMRARYAQ